MSISVDSLYNFQISLVIAMEEEVPIISDVPQKFDILTGSICVICNDARGCFSAKKSTKINNQSIGDFADCM